MHFPYFGELGAGMIAAGMRALGKHAKKPIESGLSSIVAMARISGKIKKDKKNNGLKKPVLGVFSAFLERFARWRVRRFRFG